MIALEDAVRLLSAVARQWVDDARSDDAALAALADWLNMPADELCRRLSVRRCRTCGAELPERRTKVGQRKLYCSKACSQRAAAIRTNKIHVPQ